MKKYFIIFITAALCAASCATKSDIRDLQQQIDELSTGRIATAEEQMKSISTTADELTDLLTSLKKESESISYSDFKSLETTISGAIDDLKKYIDDQDAANRSWSQQTLATLDAYKTLSDSMAGISTRISKMDNGLPAIKEKVDGILGIMSTWINEQFNGYCTISLTDAMLNLMKGEYEGEDGELSKQLDSLSTELGALKDELSEGYTAAIQEAITSFNGSITPKIKTACDKVTNDVLSYCHTIDVKRGELYNSYDSQRAFMDSYDLLGTRLIVAPNYNDGGILIKQYADTKITIVNDKGQTILSSLYKIVRIHFTFSDGTTWTGEMNSSSKFSYSYRSNSEILDKTEFFSGEVSATVYFTASIGISYSVPSKVFKAHAAVKDGDNIIVY